MESIQNKNIGFAITASYCTFSKILEPISILVDAGANIIPILSYNASNLDSRFYKAADFKEEIRKITGRDVIDTIAGAEPIGPKATLDLLIVAPCTGNTLAKLAGGITDTPVTMACKAHIRNKRPILIGISTNDGLSANASNLGKLINTKEYYFIPFHQDDGIKKPCSLIARWDMMLPAVKSCFDHIQLQPMITA